MFAFKLGRFIGIAAVIIGALQVAFGFLLASQDVDMRRYFPGTTGEQIDFGLTAIAFGVMFWMIAEIGFLLKRLVEKREGSD